MKAIALLSVLLLTACGKYEVGSEAEFKDKSLNPVKIGTSESEDIRDICSALTTKELTLSSLVGQSYTFSGTKKDCDATSASTLSDSTTTIVNQGGQFKFSEGVNLFYFSDVETTQVGLLPEICAAASSGGELVSPIVNGTNVLYFTTQGINLNDCPNQADEICIQIEKATIVETSEGRKGRPHTKEWARFRIEQPRLGFFSHRKTSSIGGCLEGKFFERSATLK